MAFLWRLSVKHITVTPILPHSLTVCFRKAGLKLPVSCCCNSSVHCSTGQQQNVDDDYCACRPRQCRVKAVRGLGGGLRGIHILRAPTFFLNRGPAWSKSGPVPKSLRCPRDACERSTVISVSVCLSVRLYVCSHVTHNASRAGPEWRSSDSANFVNIGEASSAITLCCAIF